MTCGAFVRDDRDCALSASGPVTFLSGRIHCGDDDRLVLQMLKGKRRVGKGAAHKQENTKLCRDPGYRGRRAEWSVFARSCWS